LKGERYNATRLRRLRGSESLRGLVRETRLDVGNLVAPVFVRDGVGIVEKISSMPGVSRFTVDKVCEYVGGLYDSGIRALLLFGIPSLKDENGSQAYSDSGVIPAAIREIKKLYPSMVVATDVCLCGYTTHGHCGVLTNGKVDNDRTLPLLAKSALVYASAGADIVAPSAMMDNQVMVIRRDLDDSGFKDTLVMSYSAKYASCFYEPFREAAASAPSFGDRRGYQMNPANWREAMREIETDILEGADIVMVKPALAYLDIIQRARCKFNHPLAAFSVSGEYALVKAAAANGWIDEKSAVIETSTAIRRAGADIIITYFAAELAGWLREGL
jgi:porphobilinogen synthase